MNRRRWTLALTALACGMLLGGRTARADGSSGIDLGVGRLRLGVDLSAAFDSGVSRSQAIPGDLVERVQGRFDLRLKTPVLALRADASLGWNQFAGLFSASTVPLSFLSARFEGNVATGAGKPLGLEVSESFRRGDWTTNPVFRYAVLDAVNNTNARLRFSPQGTPLEFGVAGYFKAGFYESQLAKGVAVCTDDPGCDPAQARYFNHIHYGGLLDTRWRLSQSTTLLFEVGAGNRQYLSGAIGNEGGSQLIGGIGVGSFLTSRLRIQFKAGYGGLLFHAGAPSVHTLTWAADLRYQLSEVLAFRAGTTRHLEPTAGTNRYYSDNRGYLSVEYAPVRVLTLALNGSVDGVGLSSASVVQVLSAGGEVSAEWASTDWLRVIGSIAMNGRSPVGPLTAVNSGLGFRRIIAAVGVSATF